MSYGLPSDVPSLWHLDPGAVPVAGQRSSSALIVTAPIHETEKVTGWLMGEPQPLCGEKTASLPARASPPENLV
jgi:hypothetical protein